MDKEELVDRIKEWINIDNELKELQKASKERRLRKKELTDTLVHVMKDNEIDCFDVKEGKLIYTQNKVKTSLSKKKLLLALQSYYKDDPIQCKNVSEFILNSREEKINETIRRKITK